MGSAGHGAPQCQELLRPAGSSSPSRAGRSRHPTPCLLLCLRARSRLRNSAAATLVLDTRSPSLIEGVGKGRAGAGGGGGGAGGGWLPGLLPKQPSCWAQHHRTPGRPPLLPWPPGVVLGAGWEATIRPRPPRTNSPTGRMRQFNRMSLPTSNPKSLSPAGFPFSAARRLGAWERREGRGWSCPTGRQSWRHLTPESKYPRFHTFLSSCANTGGYVEHRPQPAEQPQGGPPAPLFPQISPATFTWRLRPPRTWS